MATQPPSQFAALLRQSRFASFDPTISQAYTSYGGHSHRGNFGLKRPLPIRFRNATVQVRAVDSRQQQTEWKSAEQERRWIQMWEEVGITPYLTYKGIWPARLGPIGRVTWLADSDFVAKKVEEEKVEEKGAGDAAEEGEAQKLDKKGEGKSRAFKNIHAMSEREFQSYLKKLRSLRPAFREFLRKEAEAAEKPPPRSLWQESVGMSTGNMLNDFRARLAWEEYHSNTPTSIEQRPHKYAGLTYDAPPRLQSDLLRNYKPGHLLQATSKKGQYTTSFAGMTPRLSGAKEVLGTTLAGVNWKELAATGEYDPQPSVAQLRFYQARLYAGPTVVGSNTRGLSSAGMLVAVATDNSMEEKNSKANKAAPGSPEYVSFAETTGTTPMLSPLKRDSPPAMFGKESGARENLLNKLNEILRKPGQDNQL